MLETLATIPPAYIVLAPIFFFSAIIAYRS
jgi:hypothetical protein